MREALSQSTGVRLDRRASIKRIAALAVLLDVTLQGTASAQTRDSPDVTEPDALASSG